LKGKEKEMDWEKVTEKQWRAYRGIQESGVTNMFAVDTVVNLSGGVLNKDACLAIMQHYGDLEGKFGP